MGIIDELTVNLKKLRLSGVLETLDIRIQEATENNLSHHEFLFRLLDDERQRREARQLTQRLQRANFEGMKTLEDFNFAFNPQVPKHKIVDLATCNFVRRHESVLIVGPSGVGKSHIAQALGHRACRFGFSVMYRHAHHLFANLRASRADASYEKTLARITKEDLLIIDDLGLHPLPKEQAIDLYELIRLRYEKAATVITSNRNIDEWYPLFGDELLASAAVDRLLHHSNLIIMEGDTYRNTPKQKRRLRDEAA